MGNTYLLLPRGLHHPANTLLAFRGDRNGYGIRAPHRPLEEGGGDGREERAGKRGRHRGGARGI
jgi:hypothetical protein